MILIHLSKRASKFLYCRLNCSEHLIVLHEKIPSVQIQLISDLIKIQIFTHLQQQTMTKSNNSQENQIDFIITIDFYHYSLLQFKKYMEFLSCHFKFTKTLEMVTKHFI